MTLSEHIASIRLVVLDLDGVLTDGGLYFTAEGQSCQLFNVKDGHGIRLLLYYGIEIAIISGRDSAAGRKRIEDLGISKAYWGCHNKREAFEQLLSRCDISAAETICVGDDLPDLPMLRCAGLACAVNDAHEEVKKFAAWVLSACGGKGAVRELSDRILKEKGYWDKIMEYNLQ